MRRKVDECSFRVLDALRHLLCIGDCHVLLELASHLVGEDSVWNVLFLREVLGRLEQVLVQPFGAEARDSRLRHEAVDVDVAGAGAGGWRGRLEEGRTD